MHTLLAETLRWSFSVRDIPFLFFSWGPSKCVKMRQNRFLSGFIGSPEKQKKVRQNASKYVKMRQNASKCVKMFQNTSKYFKRLNRGNCCARTPCVRVVFHGELPGGRRSVRSVFSGLEARCVLWKAGPQWFSIDVREIVFVFLWAIIGCASVSDFCVRVHKVHVSGETVNCCGGECRFVEERLVFHLQARN